ncbi:MAG: hypothetical protein NVS9B1_07750 [Candidatus Dormibacteraceae bacterium]
MDGSGCITGWGARAEQTFGWPASEAIGRLMSDLIVPPRYRAAHIAGLERFLRTGEGPVLGKVLELSAVDRDGHEFPAEIAISLAAAVDGRVMFIAFIRDITERQEARERQEELLVAAREAQRSLRDFASMAVHELRAPLTVASGYISMMVDGSLGEPGPVWVKAADKVSLKLTEMLHLVDDLLATAKAESGGLDPQLETVDLRHEAAAAVERARGRAELAGAELNLRNGDRLAAVAADSEMVGTILDNLINNAIAYAGTTPHVTVEVRPASLEVRVSDDGPGVPEGMREAIFERFVRITRPEVPPGSGLGLYLSRRLAQAQGGTLELQDPAPGTGTTFILRLPAMKE